ncbi:MAG: hypothetical protein RSA29_04520 [Clostridium sp.]|uniref:hypothetical protein n=1 Tax=Clostridium sp. TaxID=1506 RepID=UPI0032177B1E
MIELKNIDLSSVTNEEQSDKVIEELNELMTAIKTGTDDEVVEETLDTFQSLLGLILKRRNITAYEVMESYPKHLEKLKFRPR